MMNVLRLTKPVIYVFIIMLTGTNALNVHSHLACESPLAYNSPLACGIMLTGLSTCISVRMTTKLPIPQPERRKVIQSIFGCAAISTTGFVSKSKKIEPNISPHEQQQEQRNQILSKHDHKVLRTTRGHLGSRHEFLSQLIQEAQPLRSADVHQGLLQQDDVCEERQA